MLWVWVRVWLDTVSVLVSIRSIGVEATCCWCARCVARHKTSTNHTSTYLSIYLLARCLVSSPRKMSYPILCTLDRSKITFSFFLDFCKVLVWYENFRVTIYIFSKKPIRGLKNHREKEILYECGRYDQNSVAVFYTWI